MYISPWLSFYGKRCFGWRHLIYKLLQFTLLLHNVKHHWEKKKGLASTHTTRCYSFKSLYTLGKWKSGKAYQLKKIKIKQRNPKQTNQNKIPVFSFHITSFPLLDFLGWGVSPSMALYPCDQSSAFAIWIAKLHTSAYGVLAQSSLESSFQHIWLWYQHREMHNTLHKNRNAQEEGSGELWPLKLLQAEQPLQREEPHVSRLMEALLHAPGFQIYDCCTHSPRESLICPYFMPMYFKAVKP